MRPIQILAFALSLLSAWPALADGLVEVTGSHGLTPDQLGFVVVDVESGQVLAEHQADRAVVQIGRAHV